MITQQFIFRLALPLSLYFYRYAFKEKVPGTFIGTFIDGEGDIISRFFRRRHTFGVEVDPSSIRQGTAAWVIGHWLATVTKLRR
jgi:hypothetical protein